MAYTGYEFVADDAINTVEGLTRSYTNKTSKSYEITTDPTLVIVESHLTSVHAEMFGMLVSAGYAGVQTDEEVLQFLKQYQARGACYYIELSKASSGFAAEDGQGRLAEFARWRTQLENFLETDALELMGADLISSTIGEARFATAGGLTISELADRTDDSDYKPMATEENFTNRRGRNVLQDEAE